MFDPVGGVYLESERLQDNPRRPVTECRKCRHALNSRDRDTLPRQTRRLRNASSVGGLAGGDTSFYLGCGQKVARLIKQSLRQTGTYQALSELGQISLKCQADCVDTALHTLSPRYTRIHPYPPPAAKADDW